MEIIKLLTILFFVFSFVFIVFHIVSNEISIKKMEKQIALSQSVVYQQRVKEFADRLNGKCDPFFDAIYKQAQKNAVKNYKSIKA